MFITYLFTKETGKVNILPFLHLSLRFNEAENKMSIREFIKSEDTEFGLRVVIGGAIPLFLLGYLGYTQEGLLIMIGSTFISGIDIPAELPRKLRLMLFSLMATPLVFTTISLASPYPMVLYPLLAAMIFLISFIAPFSFHFGKVAFMSNLAIMLSMGFSANLNSTDEIFRSAGLLAIGGVWYLLFASLMHFIQRPVQVSRRVSDVLQATAAYFEVRTAFFQPSANKEEILLELSKKQAELTDQHEKVRALLMRDFDYSSRPKAPLGRYLHFFALLVDLFEDALATSWRLQEAIGNKENDALEELLCDINGSIVNILTRMDEYINGSFSMEELQKVREEVKSQTVSLKTNLNQMRLDIENQHISGDDYHLFKPIQIYIEEQSDTLEHMVELLEGTVADSARIVEDKDLPYFVTRDQIRLSQMRSHLTFRSGYFRYALRVMITAMTAYFITILLDFQNPNWALFTVLVILKPGYRVSQNRLVWRVIGTSAGVILAYGLFWFLEPTHLASTLLFLAAFFGGFAFMNRNYAIASTFFTIYILFLYAFLDRNMETSAFFRFINTLLAAVLSIFSIRMLFPFWENKTMKYYLTESIGATAEYLGVIYHEYMEPKVNITAYKIARKDAQLAMGNLTHAFQRILSEPKNKQGDTSDYASWSLSASSLLAVCSNVGLSMRRKPDFVLEQQYLKDHFRWILDYFHQVNDSIKYSKPLPSEDDHLESLRELKADYSRLKKEVNQLASGYTEIYLLRIHEYFLVNELIALYHLINHLYGTTQNSSVLSEGSSTILYS